VTAVATCDQCTRRFVVEEWHPATVGDDGEIYEFCSSECRRRFGGVAPTSGQ
jgi:ribosomal protein L24E